MRRLQIWTKPLAQALLRPLPAYRIHLCLLLLQDLMGLLGGTVNRYHHEIYRESKVPFTTMVRTMGCTKIRRQPRAIIPPP
jgi:hypothetical protein